MSFIKYLDQTEGNGRGPVSWSRSHLDGAPFRGKAPLLRDEEYEDLAETVYDFKAEIFDFSDPEQVKKYKEICDRASNGWYRMIYQDRKWIQKDGSETMLIYAEWLEPHRELNPSRAIVQP